ncbi:MAG: hypothetical protein UR96_C0020G0004 [candidate division WS6 bacterium GW2011_GWC1_36_11]|uniref:Uncharacterized protein n=3 Tax=Candidatus Dojkabacteria TaxID=74243 RepID=A0A0G0DFF2_9BACT|nr:MAG: hypothetical protein UR96_C0020G0004 [candidate division WS6 bacterium GW2011_GWC1_36_11]KKQ03417.1 MAG: hypothetical protein US14_C0035G0009 [candidate division WS6 bacterium GW2011_WS6_36_26]KKQ12109.1 MAG: hypothetical protein US24_C0005G0016 [candidate division WS6 bacterium GW2011_GWC2_36_7]KKQ17536.1 MAG: hypothetical protein US29_C0007G0010 [candidate division WS6 bacterium GW2011_GWF1_36_8]HAM37571.1 hypothetical protein [Patescibacteria group bacterium]
MYTDIKENENIGEVHDFLQTHNAIDVLATSYEVVYPLISLCTVERKDFGEIFGQYDDESGLHFEYTISRNHTPYVIFVLSTPYEQGYIEPTEEFKQKVLKGTGEKEIDPKQMILAWRQITFHKEKGIEIDQHVSTTVMYKGLPIGVTQYNDRHPRAYYL